MTKESSHNGAFLGIALLHLICCGLPLLLLSGVSLRFLVPQRPFIGIVLVALGVIGFVWYLKRGCTTCPRNEACRGSSCDLPSQSQVTIGTNPKM